MSRHHNIANAKEERGTPAVPCPAELSHTDNSPSVTLSSNAKACPVCVSTLQACVNQHRSAFVLNVVQLRPGCGTAHKLHPIPWIPNMKALDVKNILRRCIKVAPGNVVLRIGDHIALDHSTLADNGVSLESRTIFAYVVPSTNYSTAPTKQTRTCDDCDGWRRKIAQDSVLNQHGNEVLAYLAEHGEALAPPMEALYDVYAGLTTGQPSSHCLEQAARLQPLAEEAKNLSRQTPHLVCPRPLNPSDSPDSEATTVGPHGDYSADGSEPINPPFDSPVLPSPSNASDDGHTHQPLLHQLETCRAAYAKLKGLSRSSPHHIELRINLLQRMIIALRQLPAEDEIAQHSITLLNLLHDSDPALLQRYAHASILCHLALAYFYANHTTLPGREVFVLQHCERVHLQIAEQEPSESHMRSYLECALHASRIGDSRSAVWYARKSMQLAIQYFPSASEWMCVATLIVLSLESKSVIPHDTEVAHAILVLRRDMPKLDMIFHSSLVLSELITLLKLDNAVLYLTTSKPHAENPAESHPIPQKAYSVRDVVGHKRGGAWTAEPSHRVEAKVQ